MSEHNGWKNWQTWSTYNWMTTNYTDYVEVRTIATDRRMLSHQIETALLGFAIERLLPPSGLARDLAIDVLGTVDWAAIRRALAEEA